MLDWLLDRMMVAADAPAIANGRHVSTYRQLLERVAHWQRELSTRGIAGRVVSIEAEYGAEAVNQLLREAEAIRA